MPTYDESAAQTKQQIVLSNFVVSNQPELIHNTNNCPEGRVEKRKSVGEGGEKKKEGLRGSS